MDRWRTIEQVFGFLRYYVIILYYVITFIYLYYGVPTVINVLHLLLLCFLVVRQILYKETISQWIYSGVAFFLIFITKQALDSSIHCRYVAILPVVNGRVESAVVHLPWIQNKLFSIYEMGFIPESPSFSPIPL